MNVRTREPSPRIETDVDVQGKNLDEIVARAHAELRAFFGKQPFEIIEVRAHPLMQTIAGEIVLWHADVQGGAVWG